jgi:hypothetical protein
MNLQPESPLTRSCHVHHFGLLTRTHDVHHFGLLTRTHDVHHFGRTPHTPLTFKHLGGAARRAR